LRLIKAGSSAKGGKKKAKGGGEKRIDQRGQGKRKDRSSQKDRARGVVEAQASRAQWEGGKRGGGVGQGGGKGKESRLVQGQTAAVKKGRSFGLTGSKKEGGNLRDARSVTVFDRGDRDLGSDLSGSGRLSRTGKDM